MAEEAKVLTNKDARISTTTTPPRKNPVQESARKNYRRIGRGSTRK